MRNLNTNIIGQFGQEIELSFSYGNGVYGNDDVYRTRVSYDGEFFTTVMQCCEVVTPVVMHKGDVISNVTLKYILGNEDTSINYGDFIIADFEKDVESGNYTYTCYDQMVKSMIPYDLEFEGNYTLATFIKAIADRIGYEFDETVPFCNSSKIINSNPYDSNSTYRDVLEDLAQASASIVCIVGNTLTIRRSMNETTVTLDEDGLKSATINDYYSPLNSVVLSRGDVEDSVYARDEESIVANGLNEIKFDSNPLLDDTDDSIRLQSANNILNAVNGLNYYEYEIESFGIGVLELFDGFNLVLASSQTEDEPTYTTYHCYALHGDVLIEQGVNEKLGCEKPSGSQTDYSVATPEALATRAYVKVDKINNKINALVEDTEGRLSTLEQTAEGFTETISQINEDLTEQKTVYSRRVDGAYITSNDDNSYSKFTAKGMEIYSSGVKISEVTSDTHKAPSFTTDNWTMREEGYTFNIFRGDLDG